VRKPNKYLNIKTKIDGITFDSKKEAKRYQDLKFMLRARKISNLITQPKFKFEINGKPLKTKDKGARQVTYTADFQYDMEGITIVEDVKSPATAKLSTFRIKKALFETIFDKELTLV